MLTTPVHHDDQDLTADGRPVLESHMRLSQLQQPLRAAASSLLRPTLPLAESLSRLQITSSNALVSGRRHASVKAQGAYKVQPKKTVMKKLGAKRTGGTAPIDPFS